jgi:two-component system cell cycle response regulator
VNVFLIEPDLESSQFIQQTISHFGHDVTVCQEGEHALEAIRKGSFDAIIADWDCPDNPGLELCREVRFLEEGSYPYIAIAACDTQSSRRLEAIKAGADEIIAKPIRAEAVEAVLEAANRAARARREREQQAQENQNLAKVLETANRRVNELFKGLPIPCITIDNSGIIMEWNRASERLFKKSSFEVWMQPLHEVIVDGKHHRAAKNLVKRCAAGEAIDSLSWNYPLADGRGLNLLVSTFPLKSQQGTQVGVAIALVDVTKEKKLQTEIRSQLSIQQRLNGELEETKTALELLASTDGLTGLHNYRTFHARLTKEIGLRENFESPLCVILTDIDKFKSFNDEFGHQVGDEVLRKVSAILKATIAKTEDCFVARYGGEEFVVIAPNYDLDQATALAETLRVNIEADEWTWRQVTSSFGVAQWDPTTGTLDELVRRSDEALYESKENGRNQVTAWKTAKKAAA